jgi:lipoprotein-releasing system ATP-binding protein
MKALPIIALRNVTKDLRLDSNGESLAVRIVNDVSLDIVAGEFTAITGPSGSGKTSLLYLMSGLDRPTKGEVTLTGCDITDMEEDELAELRNTQLGFIFQFHFLLPEFSALENVMMPLLARGRFTRAAAQRKAHDLLGDLGMADKERNKPHQLSGGQQQRVAIARALVNDPALLLADEPTGNLDSRNAEALYQIFRTLNRVRGQTTVVVTHDEHFASMTRRVLRILDGRIDRDSELEQRA